MYIKRTVIKNDVHQSVQQNIAKSDLLLMLRCGFITNFQISVLDHGEHVDISDDNFTRIIVKI